MLFPLLILTATGGARSNGASPAFFSFQPLDPANGVMPSVLETRPAGGCECRAFCVADPACLGYGYSLDTGLCLLTDVLPLPERLEPSAALWHWHARGGARRLGEPCALGSECWSVTPGGACLSGVCGCRPPFQLDGDRCAKTGGFLAVGNGRLSAEPTAEAPTADVDECKRLCADNTTCMACDFSPSDGRCLLYAQGIVSDAGSGGDELSFVWQFPRPDGVVPSSARLVQDQQVIRVGITTGLEAAHTCFANNAIVYPGVSQTHLNDLNAAWPEIFSTMEPSYVGLDDLLVEGTFVTSDGEDAPSVGWGAIEPNNANNEDCVTTSRDGVFLNDVECHLPFMVLCQYMGDNLALGKLSWMSMVSPGSAAANGNDGDPLSAASMTLTDGPPLTWTVDLGGPVQVTSVLFASGAAVGRDTEVRVGSDWRLFDELHSARCVLRAQPFVAFQYARLLRCDEPVTGRYVRIIRRGPELTLELADLAVFGNRLEAPEGGCPACP
ncbi:Collectin-11 [Amphibalanus amphitrite]|uniref:Collectin-11 n=1 Tax=Amphibalanus amphitrite TaxID=1232801 RepID=A0A6A4W0U6_AMPAM|nr:Collectin-11 [Amphibalanus amphitrite]